MRFWTSWAAEDSLRHLKAMLIAGVSRADVVFQIAAAQHVLRKATQMLLEDQLDFCLLEKGETASSEQADPELKAALASCLR